MSQTVVQTEVRTPALNRLMAKLSASARQEMMAGVAESLAQMVQVHLIDYAATHHATAARLGAMPTGHLERASESVQPSHTDNSALVTVASPGIGRAARDLAIRPKGPWPLTIPIHALAYGKRAKELRKELGAPLFRPVAKGGNRAQGPFRSFLAARVNGVFTPLYALKTTVTVPHDPTLMPERAAVEAEAKAAIRRFLFEEETHK